LDYLQNATSKTEMTSPFEAIMLLNTNTSVTMEMSLISYSRIGVKRSDDTFSIKF